MSSNPCIYIDYGRGAETIKTADEGYMYGCMAASQSLSVWVEA